MNIKCHAKGVLVPQGLIYSLIAIYVTVFQDFFVRHQTAMCMDQLAKKMVFMMKELPGAGSASVRTHKN